MEQPEDEKIEYAKKLVKFLNERVRKELLRQKKKHSIIAAKADMTKVAISTFSCGHNDLCQTNLITVWLVMGKEYEELVTLSEEDKALINAQK